jgi:sugar phosphate isomerase/epimerase
MGTAGPMMQTRRQFGKAILAAPVLSALGADSVFGGVQVGVISYSFRALAAEQILPAIVNAGLTEVELMSNHAEALVGAPTVQRSIGGVPDTQGIAALEKWRAGLSMDKYHNLATTFASAGVNVRLLCYNLPRTVKDDEIEYCFRMAEALNVRAISSTAQLPTARRVAPFAQKHRIRWGGHNHDRTDDPEEFATVESLSAIMTLGEYMAVNLDVGHFTAANYDAVAFIREHHARITNLHLKDRKKNHGANVTWGEGDTPLRAVLQLLKDERYDIPANIEYEYMGKDDPVTEVGRCVQYCRAALI